MRYFLDTEHTDDGERFELISIAVVCEDGREYYAAVEGYDGSAVTPWIAENTCWDLWQLEAELGVSSAERLPEPDGVHTALIDARYHKRIYESLRSRQSTRSA